MCFFYVVILRHHFFHVWWSHLFINMCCRSPLRLILSAGRLSKRCDFFFFLHVQAVGPAPKPEVAATRVRHLLLGTLGFGGAIRYATSSIRFAAPLIIASAAA